MTTDKLKRANAIVGELAMIERALCRTNPSKLHSLSCDGGAIAELAKLYEDEFCEIVVRHQKALEEEFAKL